jgi:hypothetical protein
MPQFEAKSFIARRVWFLYMLRFLLYLDFLKKHTKYRRIMLTDVRDVWFQHEPFAWMDGCADGVYCFSEMQGRTIGMCTSNTSMVREALGDKRWEEASSCQISCAGVTLGFRDSMMQYLERMCRYAFETKVFKTCSGVDQGFHNWIVHRDPVEGLLLMDNNGPVFTMGFYDDDDILINQDGFVSHRGNAGTIPSILHQYDRHPKIMEHLGITP